MKNLFYANGFSCSDGSYANGFFCYNESIKMKNDEWWNQRLSEGREKTCFHYAERELIRRSQWRIFNANGFSMLMVLLLQRILIKWRMKNDEWRISNANGFSMLMVLLLQRIYTNLNETFRFDGAKQIQ